MPYKIHGCIAMSYKCNLLRCALAILVISRSLPYCPTSRHVQSKTSLSSSARSQLIENDQKLPKKRVTIIGAGWGGLSAAHTLSSNKDTNIAVTVVEASPRVGGLVRDGFSSSSKRPAEAGQHGFWNNYHNIYRFLRKELKAFDIDKALTGYDQQGQWSPRGLEAVWPVYRDRKPQLPTGLAQAAYTTFLKLPLMDQLSAFPLVLAFSEFLDDEAAYERYDQLSFRDLCIKLGVSRRCYEEAFEPMILTGLFAPGNACSAAAALGMAYFFVLQSQNAFDVQWCRGNIGQVIFAPWVEQLQESGVKFECSTRVTGFEISNDTIHKVKCVRDDGTELIIHTDTVVFAVGAKALNAFSRFCPELSCYAEFRGFSNLRGTSVLATRIYLDQEIPIRYSANACWGFDREVGMTLFDIRALHGKEAPSVRDAPGSVIEVDYYHSNTLLTLSDEEIIKKVKRDLNTILRPLCRQANVVDAAIVRLPEAVNWYYPGSYKYLPPLKSTSLANVFFCGDIAQTTHGSWSQEKAFVTGKQVANLILDKHTDHDVIPLSRDEAHVELGQFLFSVGRTVFGAGDKSRGPSLADFLW